MDRFLDALRPLICRWALVWTGSADVAEDVAQAVLLRVHRSLTSFESGRVTTWAYKITQNVLLDLEKTSSRERRRRDGFAEILELGTPHDDALEVMAKVDLLSRFMRVLSPQQRVALDLVAMQGFSQTEAAEMLDVSVATLRVHLYRARLAMRAQASEDERTGGA
jgi:RNA polymerase sigma-70 factor (ECF subfamily)